MNRKMLYTLFSLLMIAVIALGACLPSNGLQRNRNRP